ncbi:MAG TPA: hypothetical protein VF544_04610 [Pyrinomonadaceae bacterium]|jgi:hypothetical protein
MEEQNGFSSGEPTRLNSEERGAGPEPTRAEERDDVAEPDAPTAVEENAGMSTVLDAGPLTGVQTDANEK